MRIEVNESLVPPTPEVGMRVVDRHYPKAVWEVVQYRDWPDTIYIRRESDGFLYHHSDESWDRAWKAGWFVHPEAVASTATGERDA